MYPILWQFGDVILPAWHLLFALAAVATGLSFLSLATAAGYKARPLRLLFGLCYFGGYFGARAINIIFEEQDRGQGFLSALITPGGMTFYGGFLAALIIGLVFLWLCPPTALYHPRASSAHSDQRANLQTRLRLVDLALLCGLLGLGIGRIGCFLNGDDYGLPVPDGSLWQPLAVSFPKVLDFIPRYPVQLISTAFALSVFALGVPLWQKRRLQAGRIALGAIGCYALFRFSIEFWRGDPRHFWSGYSISQWVSAALLAGLALGWAITAITGKKAAAAAAKGSEVTP